MTNIDNTFFILNTFLRCEWNGPVSRNNVKMIQFQNFNGKCRISREIGSKILMYKQIFCLWVLERKKQFHIHNNKKGQREEKIIKIRF